MKILKIGSNNQNDIHVSNDPTVSRFHAEIFWDGAEIIVVTDKNSTNGTFVNGRKISGSVRLNALDILKVGTTLVDWMSHIDPELVDNSSLAIGKQKSGNESKPKGRKNRWGLIVSILFLIVIVLIFLFGKPKVIYGCTDVKAYNFNSEATKMKDSSCVFKTYKDWNIIDQGSKIYIDTKDYPNAIFSFVYNTIDTISSSWQLYTSGLNQGKSFYTLDVIEIDTIVKSIPLNGSSNRPPYFYLPKKNNVEVLEQINSNRINKYFIDIVSNKYLINPGKINRYKIDRTQYVLTSIPDYLRPELIEFTPKIRNDFFNLINYRIDFWFKAFPSTIEIDIGEIETYKYNLVRY